MGCVTGQLARLDRVGFGIGRQEGVSFSLVRLDCVQASLSLIERVCGAAERVERVDGTVSRVCHVGTLFYLRVTPAEPQWITPDTPLVYQVECNTAWRVE